MKEFSEYEKKILRSLIRVDETPGGLTILGNIIHFELYPNYYIELKSEEKCPVRIAKSHIDKISNEYGPTGLNEALRQLDNKLLFIVKLFQYLEREGQIYLSGEFPLKTLGSKFDVSETPVGYELKDEKTISLIYHFARKKIIPVESLKKFVQNDFKTDTQIEQDKKDKRAQKTINWTAFGVISSLIIGIISNIPKFIELCQDPKLIKVELLNDPLKIETNCCDSSQVTITDTNIEFDNLYFEFDSTGILPASEFHINKILKILEDNKSLTVEIIGKTDSVGTEVYNNELSLKRAKSVALNMINMGLNSNRVKLYGLSESAPVSNKSYYYRMWKNRKVELRIK